MKQFCEKKTTEEMKEASRKATEEGMRVIAEALAKKIIREKGSDSESDSDSDSSNDSDSEKDTYRVRELEKRIHYMKLDMSNMQLRIMELENFETVVKHLGLCDKKMSEMDSVILELRSTDFKKMRMSEINYKWNTLNEKMKEKIDECNTLLEKPIGLAQIDNALRYICESKKELFLDDLDSVNRIITWKELTMYLYTFLALFAFFMTVIIYMWLR